MNIFNKMNSLAIGVIALITASSFVFPALPGTILHRPPGIALKMPRGFHVQVVADALGTARHLAVSKQGLIYIKLERNHLQDHLR